MHPRFELLEVLGREGPLEGEVVVEAVLDHRADRDLGVGVDRLHGLREQVRGRVAEDLEAVGVLGRDDGDRARRGRSRATVSTSLPSTLPASAALARPGPMLGGELRDGQRLVDSCAGCRRAA